MGKAVLVRALVIGASATIPGAGAVIVPLYAAYNYFAIGISGYNFYSTWQRNKQVGSAEFSQLTAGVADTAFADSEEQLAHTIVRYIQRTGAIDQVAKQTGVDPVVYSEMLSGSVSSALSTGFQECAKFSIEKVVGG